MSVIEIDADKDSKEHFVPPENLGRETRQEFLLANNQGKKKVDGQSKKATAVIKRIKKAPSNLARSQTPQRSLVSKGRRKGKGKFHEPSKKVLEPEVHVSANKLSHQENESRRSRKSVNSSRLVDHGATHRKTQSLGMEDRDSVEL